MHVSPIRTLAAFAIFGIFSTLGAGATPKLSSTPPTPGEPRYIVIDLGPALTPFSLATGVTKSGVTSGLMTLSSGIQNAVFWQPAHRAGADQARGLQITDIGSPGLGGPNSTAYGVSDSGGVTGQAETSNEDPNGEDFCGYGTHLQCLAFLYQNGALVPLPTLGGSNGSANQVNSFGNVAGYAETSTPDATCKGLGISQVLQEKPVVWKSGKAHELRTFHGDPDGVAFSVNDAGMVVGSSGVCSAFTAAGDYLKPLHALLWDGQSVVDLGNLGGISGHQSNDVNNRGQVVGVSDLKGDKTFHGFLWTKATGMRDLGTLAGDVASLGCSINDRGELVGGSFDAKGNARAFLRLEHGLIDLNTLVNADSPLHLGIAHGINESGVIVGLGIQKAAPHAVHAFMAIPRNRDEDTVGTSTTSVAAPHVPQDVRRTLLLSSGR